jgi:transposase
LITNIDTVPAYSADAEHLLRGQDVLAEQELLPARQFVDGAYVGTQLILESRKKHGIEVIGPVKQNSHHSQEAEGYDITAFKIDWEHRFATCPQGKRSTGWWQSPRPYRHIHFAAGLNAVEVDVCHLAAMN